MKKLMFRHVDPEFFTPELTSEDKEAIAREFTGSSADAPEILQALDKIWSRFTAHHPPLISTSEHKERLQQISKAARNLRDFLRTSADVQEILITREREESGVEPDAEFDDEYAFAKWVIFRDILENIETEARRTSADTERLRKIRRDYEASSARKSLEREYLWEPIFALWVASGRKIGFSEDGPIMRILRILHARMELPKPKPHSVRQAIRDYNKGGVQKG
jgi:hypothetical protein